ncbi:MAG: DUF4303 domain-containing protein [Micrococcales bacterium]|nr:DUF4303 domain-containing protein [Micrococcales bacterium]
MDEAFDQLVDAIADAARQTFLDLFENGEHYYYAGLNIFEGVMPPTACAWSSEALEREESSARSNGHLGPELWLKWSYADSPYNCYKHEKYFSEVDRLLLARPHYDLDDDAVDAEFDLRNEAMVAAMESLDAEGIFALNQPRDAIIINVENQPPDAMNLANARRLNPPRALADWLEDNRGEFE